MEVDDLCGLRITFFQFVHQDAQLNNLRMIVRGCFRTGTWVVERRNHIPAAANLRQSGASEIDQNTAHRVGGDRIEMFAVANLPSASMQTSQPDFVNQFGRR
jgi:hypothetical protein